MCQVWSCFRHRPGPGLVQQLAPPLGQTLQLALDLVSVLGLGRRRDPLALGPDHLHRGPPVVQQPLEQLEEEDRRGDGQSVGMATQHDVSAATDRLSLGSIT